MTVSPSGAQYELINGGQRATIVEVGGGVRSYEAGGVPVLDPYPPDAVCDGAHGAPLIPWPNRLADGRYSFDGEDHQVSLSEPDKRNAIHGFLRWRNWRATERAADRVVMAMRLYPLTGWPFALDVRLTYSLGDDGLTVETRAENVGSRACPFASGQHPYLSPGEGLVDACELSLPAATRILVDDERQLPLGSETVADGPFDFRSGRAIGDLRIDYPFTDLQRERDGRAVVRLTRVDGWTAELWADQSYPVLEVYTGDTLAPARRRRGLAVEPMTCPPNALQTGDGIVRLEPGEAHVSRWGVRLV